MYAKNNICADARENMSKYTVVLVLYTYSTLHVAMTFAHGGLKMLRKFLYSELVII